MTTRGTQRRSALLVTNAHGVMEGAGVPIRRALPSRDVAYDLVDPFLLLDDANFRLSGDAAGFPPHPHRGFEIITYSLKGPIEQVLHTANREEKARSEEGGLMRITAGSGMTHGEGPSGRVSQAEREVHGLQLWINLARADKRVEPSVQSVQPDEIPSELWGPATVRVLVGEGSPTRLHTPATYLDIALPAGQTLDVPLPEGWQGFAYLLEGEGDFGSTGAHAGAGQLVVLGQGGPFGARAGASGVRFVLGAGKPYGEAPRWNGPYVD